MSNEINHLVQYFESLEQQIAALRVQVEELQKVLAQKDETLNNLSVQMQTMLQRMEEFEAREPEVEVELMVSDDEIENEPTVEPLTPEDEPTTVELAPEPIAEPIADPVVEPIAELEPVAQPEPTPNAKPQEEKKALGNMQTSLFGAAVTDIRHAISLGDRFLFQRELFGGNGEAMQKALNDLNDCKDLAGAIAYIDKLGWNKESSTYELFINVLHRRFEH